MNDTFWTVVLEVLCLRDDEEQQIWFRTLREHPPESGTLLPSPHPHEEPMTDETLPIPTHPERAVAPGVAAGRAYLIPPTTLQEAMQLAEMLSKSSFVPRDFAGKPGDVLCAIQFGAEVGLPPLQALQGIAVVNGRPALWGDAAMAVIEASGLLVDKQESITGEGDHRHAVCTMHRRGRQEPCTRTFSVADAKKANLWGKSGPWTQYPDRMLMRRARSFVQRDEFSDVLKGLSIREEMEDVVRGSTSTPHAPIPLPRAALPSPASASSSVTEVSPESESTSSNGTYISEPQRRMLFAACHKQGKGHSDLKGWLATKGLDSTARIPAALFDEALAWSETPTPPESEA